jgi:hypothetical protein
MVSEGNGPESSLRPEGNPDAVGWSVPEVAICGNDHAYRWTKNPACPICGNPDRLVLSAILSPEVLHLRITAALRFKKERSRG